MGKAWKAGQKTLSTKRKVIRVTHRPLGVEELADTIPQLVEQHGVEGRTELQPQQVLDVGAHVETNAVVAAHQQGQEPVQEAAQRGLVGRGGRAGDGGRHGGGDVSGPHGDHGVLALAHGAHGRAVGDRAGSAALLEAHAPQGAQEARHIYPLLL